MSSLSKSEVSVN